MSDDSTRIGTLLRRVRGTLGTAALWSGAFSLVGIASATVLAASVGAGFIPGIPMEALLMTAGAGILRWAAIGALSGVVFSATIMIAERQRTLAALSPTPFMRWGFLAGAVGSGLVAAAFASLLLAGSSVAIGTYALLKALAIVPLVGGALGRRTARASLRAAQRDEPALVAPGRMAIERGESMPLPRLDGVR